MNAFSIHNTSHYLKARIKLPEVILAASAFLAGMLNIASAFWAPHTARLNIMYELLPKAVLHTSRTLTLISGLFLIFLSGGLLRRKSRAWWLSMVMLTASVVLHIFKGFDFEEDILLLIPIGLLFIFKNDFTVGSARLRLIKRLGISAGILVVLFLYSTAGFFALGSQFTQAPTIEKIYQDYQYSILGVGEDTLIPTTHRARWFEDSISLAGFTSSLLILAVLFGPELVRKKPTEEDYAIAESLVGHSSVHSASFYALMDDKQYFISSAKDCALAYKVNFGTAIVLAGPLGERNAWASCAKEFQLYAAKHGWSTTYYLANDDVRDLLLPQNFKSLLIGNEAVLSLKNFTTQTPQLKNVRNSVSAITRGGVKFEWFTLDEIPWRVMRDVEKLRQEWHEIKKSGGMTFSMDFYPFPPAREAWVLVAYNPGNILVGTFSFLPYNQGKGMLLDLMQRSHKAPNGLVEASLAEAAEHFKQLGKQELNLGLSVATDEQSSGDTDMVQQGLDFLYRHSPFYNFLTLANFKQKFHPSWEPRYLLYPSGSELPKIAIALNQAMSK